VSEELILSPDQSAETVVSMPASLAQSAIEGVGVLLARSDVPADGELAVSVCAGQVCRSGLRPLSAPGESAFLEVHLDQPLAAPSGTPLRMTFTHHHGSGPLALSVAVGGDQQLHGPNGDLPGRRLHLTLAESTLARGLHKVYADSLMDIWEVSDPAPYFEVIQGGPCNLAAGQREDVTAVCSSPAKLRRRELYMPGWSVKNHGAPVQRVQQDGIFQVTALPAGSSSVYFHFSPPYIEIGWTASLAGLAGLLWQLFRIVRSRGGEIAVKGPE
jgi:hypothetical protein